VEANQRAQRAGVKFVAIIRRVEQFAVQVAIDDTGGDLANIGFLDVLQSLSICLGNVPGNRLQISLSNSQYIWRCGPDSGVPDRHLAKNYAKRSHAHYASNPIDQTLCKLAGQEACRRAPAAESWRFSMKEKTVHVNQWQCKDANDGLSEDAPNAGQLADRVQ
jgi:hypothetical protein